jgi:hypothetical protein
MVERKSRRWLYIGIRIMGVMIVERGIFLAYRIIDSCSQWPVCDGTEEGWGGLPSPWCQLRACHQESAAGRGRVV